MQPADGVAADQALTDELMGYLQGRLARYKQPRSIDYSEEIPRLPSGKILRRVVRDKYLPTV